MTMWFVLVSVLVVQPVTDGGPEKVGDVLISALMGASYDEEHCKTAGRETIKILNREGQGSSLSVFQCIEMDASVGVAQGFMEVAQ